MLSPSFIVPGGRRHQSGETCKNRRLTGAVKADQPQHFSAAYRETYIIKHTTPVEVLGNTVNC